MQAASSDQADGCSRECHEAENPNHSQLQTKKQRSSQSRQSQRDRIERGEHGLGQSEPLKPADLGEDHMKRKPQGEVENNPHNSRRYGAEGRGHARQAREHLDIWSS